MPKIVVEKSIKIGGDDINEWGEPARSNETRSFVDFSNKNGKVYISKEGYNKKYVTVYNSKKISKNTGISSDNYQSSHSRYFGKIGNEHIWIAEKGCAPTSNQVFNTNIPGDYTLKYDSTKKNIKLTTPNGKVSTIPAKIIHLFISGAGGGGKGGYYSVQYYVVWGSQQASWGGKGGKAASLSLTLDMSVLKSVSIYIGKGGSGSIGKNNPLNGDNSTITISGTTYVIGGGKAGTEYAYADVSSVDWNDDWDYKNPYTAHGGKVMLAPQGNGIYNVQCYETYLCQCKDKYSNFSYRAYSSSGGSAGGVPDKPSLNSTNNSTGGDGENGRLEIRY